jgi:hypothetical protein
MSKQYEAKKREETKFCQTSMILNSEQLENQIFEIFPLLL